MGFFDGGFVEGNLDGIVLIKIFGWRSSEGNSGGIVSIGIFRWGILEVNSDGNFRSEFWMADFWRVIEGIY